MSYESDQVVRRLNLETDEPDHDGLCRRPVSVVDKDGVRTAALLMRCPCGGEKFLVLFIGESKHQHCQCTTCGTSFCDGTCEDDAPEPVVCGSCNGEGTLRHMGCDGEGCDGCGMSGLEQCQDCRGTGVPSPAVPPAGPKSPEPDR